MIFVSVHLRWWNHKFTWRIANKFITIIVPWWPSFNQHSIASFFGLSLCFEFIPLPMFIVFFDQFRTFKCILVINTHLKRDFFVFVLFRISLEFRQVYFVKMEMLLIFNAAFQAICSSNRMRKHFEELKYTETKTKYSQF